MKLLALMILVCILPSLAGYCIKTGFRLETLGNSAAYEFLLTRPALRGKLDFNDTIGWYRVYPNNERLELTFYAVHIYHNKTNRNTFFKVRVKNGQLYHLSNFTRDEFVSYFFGCHSR